MISFSQRSGKEELLDGKNIPFSDIRRNMQELEFINTYLGGHAITIAGLKKLIQGKKSVSICEIGCGGGDNLKAIYAWCSQKNILVNLTGIDINVNCIFFAETNCPEQKINFITSDYKLVAFGNSKPDIIFSSLFCHHFSNTALIEMLTWMKRNATLGFFINDLHRHPVAYYFIKIATKIFSRSYLVKNDAPLSVLRSFTKKEWTNILQQAGIKKYSLEWKWAFRYLITCLCQEGVLRS